MQMTQTKKPCKLQMLPMNEYAAVNRDDPLRFYYRPFFGRLYRRRVEMCLEQCTGGKRILEVGFGSGLTFLNLHELYDEIYGLDLTAPVPEVAEVFARRGIKTQLLNGSVLQMPYEDGFFDTVLLVSILEHLKPEQLVPAFTEIRRVLRKGGQMVYGVPVEKPLMIFAFRMLGCNIRAHHFSTQNDVSHAAKKVFGELRINSLKSILGQVYEVGHCVNEPATVEQSRRKTGAGVVGKSAR
jgi:ubiquinone/menaquinone biosynthesis C-methylase UbiE